MSAEARRLLDATLNLPPGERALVAEALLESLASAEEVNANARWPEILEQRSREAREGRVETRDWDEVLLTARGRLHSTP
jgi:hypothetical protein